MSIAPWLSVRKSSEAVEFYKRAFGAKEVLRLEDPDGNVVARLAVATSEFGSATSHLSTATTARKPWAAAPSD